MIRHSDISDVDLRSKIRKQEIVFGAALLFLRAELR